MDEGYIPTLGEYAEVIEWMSYHPGEGVPAHMEQAWMDALRRAEIRCMVKALETMDEER